MPTGGLDPIAVVKAFLSRGDHRNPPAEVLAELRKLRDRLASARRTDGRIALSDTLELLIRETELPLA
jgi:hypothetical protein